MPVQVSIFIYNRLLIGHSAIYRNVGDVLRHLLACMVHVDSSEDLKTKAKRALKAVLAKCTHLAALQPLLKDAPMKVQKYVLRQFAQLLPHDVEARRAFVQVCIVRNEYALE